jgi:hypothetical protein
VKREEEGRARRITSLVVAGTSYKTADVVGILS